jgi:hypothetical protein
MDLDLIARGVTCTHVPEVGHTARNGSAHHASHPGLRVFDGGKGGGNESEAKVANRRTLGALGEPEIDFPGTTITDRYASFEANLEVYLQTEIPRFATLIEENARTASARPFCTPDARDPNELVSKTSTPDLENRQRVNARSWVRIPPPPLRPPKSAWLSGIRELRARAGYVRRSCQVARSAYPGGGVTVARTIAHESRRALDSGPPRRGRSRRGVRTSNHVLELIAA